ncbi:MAG: hypothetical protein AAFX54_00320 [Pseudomonadota bacterium]
MQRLQRAIKESKAFVGKSVFLAIDGLGASGKSTLASLISDALGGEIIRLDDLSGSVPLSWLPRLKAEILTPISNGATSLTYQPESWWAHKPPPVIGQPVTPSMIVEGVGSHHPQVRSFWGVTIFVETPPALCFQRGVARDLATGRPKAEIEYLWRRWQAAELAYLEAHDPARRADFVVDGTAPFSTQL